jgi:hypothetical protein
VSAGDLQAAPEQVDPQVGGIVAAGVTVADPRRGGLTGRTLGSALVKDFDYRPSG